MMTGRAGNPWLPVCLSIKGCELHETNSSSCSLRSDTMVYRGTEVRSFHGSMPHLHHPLSTHSSLHQIEGNSRHGSQRDVSEAPPTLITHGTTASDSQAAENEGTSAWAVPRVSQEIILRRLSKPFKGNFAPIRRTPVCSVCKCFPLWRWRMYQWVLWWWFSALVSCWSFVSSVANTVQPVTSLS